MKKECTNSTGVHGNDLIGHLKGVGVEAGEEVVEARGVRARLAEEVHEHSVEGGEVVLGQLGRRGCQEARPQQHRDADLQRRQLRVLTHKVVHAFFLSEPFFVHE